MYIQTYLDYVPTNVSTPKMDCIIHLNESGRDLKGYTGKTVVSSICIIRSYAISKHIYHLLNAEVRYFVFTRRAEKSCHIVILIVLFLYVHSSSSSSTKPFPTSGSRTTVPSLVRVRPYTAVSFVFFQFKRKKIRFAIYVYFNICSPDTQVPTPNNVIL